MRKAIVLPLKPNFEELDYQKTHMGELVLQRRTILSLEGREVYEVKLGEAYLMSSLFHDSEVALADTALGELNGTGWEIVVGGLGLGYTAAAALKYKQIKRLIVIEALAPVIDWHRRELVPNGRQLTRDERVIYRHADFFDLARGGGFDPHVKNAQFDAILLDIDHTPDFWLHSSHADLYCEAGLKRLKSFLRPNGIFALWSNDAPEDGFLRRLSAVFASADGREIQFDNPLQQTVSTNGVYIARCS